MSRVTEGGRRVCTAETVLQQGRTEQAIASREGQACSPSGLRLSDQGGRSNGRGQCHSAFTGEYPLNGLSEFVGDAEKYLGANLELAAFHR